MKINRNLEAIFLKLTIGVELGKEKKDQLLVVNRFRSCKSSTCLPLHKQEGPNEKSIGDSSLLFNLGNSPKLVSVDG